MRNSVTKHAGVASAGATHHKNAGRKLGNRLRKDIVGEGPINKNRTEFARANAFSATPKSPKIAGEAFKPIDTNIGGATQAALFNSSGGKI